MTSDLKPDQRRSISAASVSSSSGSFRADRPRGSHSPEAVEPSRNKIVGACSSCRKSKVKCEHNGTAPCRRCKNGGYECIFKPREMGSAFLQDEWRVRTDETLSKLVSAINALVEQEGEASPAKKRKTEGESVEETVSRDAPSGNGSFSQTSGAVPTRGLAAAPRALIGSHLGATQPVPGEVFHHPGFSAYNLPVTNSNHVTPHLGSFLASSSRRSSVVGSLDHVMDSFPVSAVTSAIGMSQGQVHNSADTDNSHPIRAALQARGSLPTPGWSAKRNSGNGRSSSPKPALIARTSRYRFPDPSLGSNDPRLDAIRLGLLSSHEARSLFSLYAKRIEPFGFGFPDFPASSELTPVLLSAITSVASLHASSSDVRTRQLRLRTDVLDRTMPYAPTTAEDEFNPESGIGTEEVVGACIWSSYEGSEQAWKVARAARWWSEKYSYETGPHAGLTVGEMVAILPPVRHVNMQDRVRVWLTAFLAELHQCEIHAKEPIMELIDPAQYGQALSMDNSQTNRTWSMTKQDAGLVFFSRIAYLITKAKTTMRNPEELIQVTREITASWCTTRALLATEPDQKNTYDHTIDLHHLLGQATLLIRACRLYEEQTAKDCLHKDVGFTTTGFVSCTQTCQSVCMDSIRLLLARSAGFLGSLAALPTVYHFWILASLRFLLELCMPDRLHSQLGLLPEGQLNDTLHVVDTFMQHYLVELSACSTSILVEEQQESEPSYEVLKHPATDAALSIADMLASVQATA